METKEEIPITRNTLRKIFTYSKIMGNTECYGFLISPKDRGDGVIYNAILAPRQVVSGSSASIDEEGAAEAKAEIENLGHVALGFWHNHAAYNAFHSSVDDQNLKDLLYDFAGNTERKVEKTRVTEGFNLKGNSVIATFNGKTLEIRLNTNEEVIATIKKSKENAIHYYFNDRSLRLANGKEEITLRNVDPSFQISEAEKEFVKGNGRAYSIVVNPKEDTYAEIAEVEWCYCCGEQKSNFIKNVGLKQIEVVKDCNFTEKELEDEIKKKVIKRGFKWFAE